MKKKQYASSSSSTYLFSSPHDSFSLARSKYQHLIHHVHFIPYISSDGNLHRHELRVKSRVDDFSELAKGADGGGQGGEIDHFVFWR